MKIRWLYSRTGSSPVIGTNILGFAICDHNHISPSEREKVMVKNYLSARDARTQTETTTKPLNVLFKMIKDHAEWGTCWLNYDVYEHDQRVITNIVGTLTQAGYSVTEQTNEEGRLTTLLISW